MPLSTRIFAVAIAALFFASACSDNSKTSSNAEARYELKLGQANVSVELAISRAAQQRGLMFRESMPENEGMLFVYERPQGMSYYMKNTEIPLDIGFFAKDGTLREMYPLYPYDENSRRSIGQDMQYALEVNQGWFKRNGISIGDSFDTDSLRAFIDRR